MFSETWLHDGFMDGEIGFYNHSVFRCDRSRETSNHSRGGGVLIAVEKSIPAKQIVTSIKNLEHLFVVISLNDCKVLLGNVYIPPRSPVELYELYCRSLEEVVSSLVYDKIVICGDFNVPDVKWSNDWMGIAVENVVVSPQALTLIDSFAFLNLYQLNRVLNAVGTILDLVVCNFYDCCVDICDQPMLLCDKYHPALGFSVPIGGGVLSEHMAFDYEYFNFRRANYVELNRFLGDFDWEVVLNVNDVDVALERFYSIVYRGFELYVPRGRAKNKKFPIWYCEELKSAIMNKKIVHKSWKRSHDLAFCNIHARCKVLTKECYKKYINNVQESIASDSKMFWKYVHSGDSGYDLPKCMTFNGITTDNPSDISEFFAQCFGSVYRRVDCEMPVIHNDRCVDVSVCAVTLVDVFESINGLKSNLAPGPDEIPVVVFKECKYVLSNVLSRIFNLSLSSGVYPGLWKVAYVTPVLKSGDKSLIQNYRPISKVSVASKLLESIVNNKLSSAFQGVISSVQHGFLRGRSTVTNLLVYGESLSRALEGGCQVDSIYTDFSRAFDTIHHGILLHKLEHLGVHGVLLAWINSYLTERRQIVRLKNISSGDISVLSGVPQGSHLAPLLFNVFINDLVNSMEFGCRLLFADDLKMFLSVYSEEDCLRLQSDINVLSVWCERNCMELNVDKCKVLTISKKRNNVLFNYSVNNVPMERVKLMKDLGVYVDSQLQFNYHINCIKNKATRMLGFLIRTLTDFNDIRCFKTLYCSYVRSGLEYACSFWSPHHDIYVDLLEKVQRRFLRFVNFKLGNSVDSIDYDYLRELVGLPPLRARRIYFDICTLFKIVNGIIDSPELLKFVLFRVPLRDTRQNELFSVGFHRTNYGMNSPISRLCREANKYCGDVDFFNVGLQTFKGAVADRLYGRGVETAV